MNQEPLPAQGPVDVVVGRHTPGPWEVAAGDDYRIEAAAIPSEYPHLFPGDDLGRMVAMVGNRQPDFGAADAALISAAPDLLAALQKVVAISDRKHDAWDEAKAAIAKATGLTPNAKSQATDAALSRQVACTDGLGTAVSLAPTFGETKC